MENLAQETLTEDSDGIYYNYLNYFNEMPCFVSVQDRNLKLRDCNKLFKKHFGAKVGEYCYEAYKGRLTKCEDCPVEKTFQTGKPQRSEEIITTLDGEEIPVYVFTSPIFDENGEVESVLEISSDITEVKSIQKKLHNTQRQLQQLFDEVPCYITMQDKDLKITSTNRKFREDFGEGVGDYCYKVYKHRDEPCLECPVAGTFDDGLSHQSEEVVTAMSGNRYNVLVTTAPSRNTMGEITHVVEMSTNITQIRQLQDQLTSLGLLVGSISHGIKGLSSALDGGMYLLNSGLEKNDKDRINKGWDIVKRNVSQIRSMIADILYYAKDRKLNYETTNLNGFVSEIVSMLKNKASSYKVEFKYEFASSLGEFTADLTSIRSALINVLENSFDACRKDLKKPLHIVNFNVVANGDGSQIIFDISDNGIGMDQETKEKAFSLFFSSKGLEGTGLGLFIANKIVKKHGGTISVSSTLGEKTSFRIMLPRHPENVQQGC